MLVPAISTYALRLSTVERIQQIETYMDQGQPTVGVPLPYSFLFQAIHYDLVLQYIAGRARACRAAIGKKCNRLYVILPEDQAPSMRVSQELSPSRSNLGH